MSFNIENISYKYSADKEAVLENVNFQIKEAQVTAIVGPSGSGKSTLVNILSGVIPELMSSGVFEGSFKVEDTINISVVSQSPESQLFGYGVEDAIAFGIENMGVENEDLVERVEYVLNLLNIQHLRKRSIATLSGGQRQAVCIASVLAMKPDILIMDEPVSSLDPNGKRLIQSLLNQLRAAGQTTVIVDNNMDWFSDIVDHVIGLYEGKVVFDGDKEEFFGNFELQEKLGVTIPQEAEIYRELSKRVKGIEKFYTLDGAKCEIVKLLNQKLKHKSSDIESIHEEKMIHSEKAMIHCEKAMKGDKAIHGVEEIHSEEIIHGEDSINNEESIHGEEILDAKGITKSFQDGFRALIDVDAAFEKGKVISILGQNGSGKTTFVKHLNGLYRPNQGVIRYLGKETTGKSVAQISKDIILVFQHPEHMLFEETVYRELTFCARAQGVSFSEEEALKVLETYDLLEDKEELPVNLSMGKKHLLTILSVLFSSAEVIILDEPTLGMDHHLKNKLEEIITYLKEKGKTVIIISHEIPLVFKISDDLLILDAGRKLTQASKYTLAGQVEIFDKINIELPPVVVLSKYFGLTNSCCDVNSFVNEIANILVEAK